MTKNLLYVLKRMVGLDYISMFKYASKISKKERKNVIIILIDIIICGFKYSAGYLDYYIFDFVNIGHDKRKTYLTRGLNEALIRKVNNPEYRHILDIKTDFYEYFKEYIGRDYMQLTKNSAEEFDNFMKNRQEIFCKPISGTGGIGILKVKKSDFNNVKELFEYLCENNIGVVENVLLQHNDMNSLNPTTVNTIRIVTMYVEGNINNIYSCVRIGSDGIVDNFHSKGYVARVDINSGKVISEAIDREGNIYIDHKITKTKFMNFQVPMWNEVIQLVEKAALKIPQIRYIGWDVCITPNGPILIEGNYIPGNDIIQTPALSIDHYGMLDIVKKYVII